MSFKRLYKLHHKLGLIVLIPIMGWCLSGLTHPIMAHWFKIEPAQRFIKIPPLPQDSSQLNLTSLLAKNTINEIHNFRYIYLNEQLHCQVFVPNKEAPLYFNTKTKKIVKNGDEAYAKQLARTFLGDQESEIKSIQKITNFTGQYKRINRLLPAYKVSFKRADGMDVYVETNSSRLGTMNNNVRKVNLWIFSQFHNWAFLDFNPTIKIIFMTIFSLLTMIVALLGVWIYLFNWKTLKKNRPNRKAIRHWHRQLGISVAIAMLAFSFSGGYHALLKLIDKKETSEHTNTKFAVHQFNREPHEVLQKLTIKAKNISVIRMKEDKYYQIITATPPFTKVYINCKTGQELKDGDFEYAKFLTQRYITKKDMPIKAVEPVYKFGGEYGFINKRLPVVKIQYDNPKQETHYIETSTGILAAKISQAQRTEAFSFLFLHKYHSLDFLGKGIRDTVMAIAALGVFFVSLLGFIMMLKSKK